MLKDMSVPCDNGLINIRVGAIILKDGKLLMVGNNRSDYLYSVGGRIKFGETAEQAVVREVLEETGVKMEIDRLGFVHENYFFGDAPSKSGKLIYEISFFFYMKVPRDFAPKCDSFTEDDAKEYLQWIPLNDERKIYPVFFRTELQNPKNEIRHFVTTAKYDLKNKGENYMQNDIILKVTEFKNTFSKTAKSQISDKEFILDYCIAKRAWKDAVIRERFNKQSTVIGNKDSIVLILKKELSERADVIRKDFDTWHDDICRRTEYGMRYGLWQKLINMTFKNLFCVKELFPEFDDIWCKCHCPIDSVIAGQLYKQMLIAGYADEELELSHCISESNKITWNSIGKENYTKFQKQVRQISEKQNLTPLEFDFKYWEK